MQVIPYKRAEFRRVTQFDSDNFLDKLSILYQVVTRRLRMINNRFQELIHFRVNFCGSFNFCG